ncbi:DNA-binding protein [Streptomyces sp. NPDC002044]|uniref:DNA-binding protein n=1 Tax=Streptomyces sp. NPDC002044 TaxID=3154662 RepID=UPI003321E191
MTGQPTPGEGPTRPVSVSLHEGTIAALKARTGRVSQARFDFAVSRVNVVAPTEAIARRAGRLLADAGPHGHKYALDALVATTALDLPGPATVLTSEPEDLSVLCGDRVRVVRI